MALLQDNRGKPYKVEGGSGSQGSISDEFKNMAVQQLQMEKRCRKLILRFLV